jgi:protein-disulfide isomerase
MCAHEQGKFWEYHDAIFENQTTLASSNLKQFAVDIGLDESSFNECFESGTFREAVQADYVAGGQLGVNATPAFFVNGRFLSGAQPFEAFKVIIDDELGN